MAISDMDLIGLCIGCAVVVTILSVFKRELLLVSVDREFALLMGKSLWVWDTLLYGLIGFAISLGVLMVGPLLTFAFLLLAVMNAVRFAPRFFVVPILASCIGRRLP